MRARRGVSQVERCRCTRWQSAWIGHASTTRLVHRIIHAMPSVVILLAAQTTSPSFSLDSSSITTTNSPLRIASTADDTESKRKGDGGVEDALAWRRGADMASRYTRRGS